MISEFRYYINGMVSQFFLGSTLKMDSEGSYVSTYTTLFTIRKIGSQFFRPPFINGRPQKTDFIFGISPIF